MCISNDLICDGIRHCPIGMEISSDEEPELCLTQQNLNQRFAEMNIWHHLSLGFLKNMFGVSDKTQIRHTVQVPITPTIEPPTRQHNVTRGLSRYGPWGYLMLGMLLCGASLLFCGLWGKFVIAYL